MEIIEVSAAKDSANAVEGFDFSEQALGTNGLGTPIEARGVVFVRGTEHFNDALASLACAGAPIKHPITGRIVGSLSIASHVDSASPLMVSMARQAGYEISEALELMADSRDLELARTYRNLRTSRNPVLVMNSGTVMTDLPALAHFDAEAHAGLWDTLRRYRWDEDSMRLELPTLGTAATVRRLGRAGQDAIFALEFTDPPSALSTTATTQSVPREPAAAASAPSFSRYEAAERDAIETALSEADGNKSQAAELLGIGRTTLYRKMRALKIPG